MAVAMGAVEVVVEVVVNKEEQRNIKQREEGGSEHRFALLFPGSKKRRTGILEWGSETKGVGGKNLEEQRRREQGERRKEEWNESGWV